MNVCNVHLQLHHHVFYSSIQSAEPDRADPCSAAHGSSHRDLRSGQTLVSRRPNSSTANKANSLYSYNQRSYSSKITHLQQTVQWVAVGGYMFPPLHQVPSTSGYLENCTFKQNIKKSGTMKCIISTSTVMTQLLKFMWAYPLSLMLSVNTAQPTTVGVLRPHNIVLEHNWTELLNIKCKSTIFIFILYYVKYIL